MMGIHARLISGFATFDGTIKMLIGKYLQHRLLGNYEFPYVYNNKGRRIYILATGPSLKTDLAELLLTKDFVESDKLCVNFFLNDDVILEVRPRYYCLADSAFFEESGPNSEKVCELYVRLNGVIDWDMTLFVYISNKEQIDFLKKRVSNPHVKVVPLTGLMYSGKASGRYESWKKGESVPSYLNVTLKAEYVALNCGFTELYLYGVEHTFFDGLGVDVDNRLFIQDKHFYGSEKRFVSSSNRREWHMKDWLYDKYLTFREHELLQGYADYLGATIINCTKNSLIDAYPHLSKIKENKSK